MPVCAWTAGFQHSSCSSPVHYCAGASAVCRRCGSMLPALPGGPICRPAHIVGDGCCNNADAGLPPHVLQVVGGWVGGCLCVLPGGFSVCVQVGCQPTWCVSANMHSPGPSQRPSKVRDMSVYTVCLPSIVPHCAQCSATVACCVLRSRWQQLQARKVLSSLLTVSHKAWNAELAADLDTMVQ